jgi:hypothetical protein
VFIEIFLFRPLRAIRVIDINENSGSASRRNPDGSWTTVHLSFLVVCEIVTPANAAAQASVESVCLAILKRQPVSNDHTIWTVAALNEQWESVCALPWTQMPRQIGRMRHEGDAFVYHDYRTGEVLTVTTDELEG